LVTPLASVTGLPQVTLPVTAASWVPVALSVVCAHVASARLQPSVGVPNEPTRLWVVASPPVLVPAVNHRCPVASVLYRSGLPSPVVSPGDAMAFAAA